MWVKGHEVKGKKGYVDLQPTAHKNNESDTHSAADHQEDYDTLGPKRLL